MPSSDAEHNFIQLLFCMNRDLLRVENRELYDVLLRRYSESYTLGKREYMDLGCINERFMNLLFKRDEKNGN